MPLKIALDSTKDLGKFILSPRAEIRRTIAALESESTAKII